VWWTLLPGQQGNCVGAQERLKAGGLFVSAIKFIWDLNPGFAACKWCILTIKPRLPLVEKVTEHTQIRGTTYYGEVNDLLTLYLTRSFSDHTICIYSDSVKTALTLDWCF